MIARETGLKANAQSLSKWLSDETGRWIGACGIVTILGWWVDDSTQYPVRALNPEHIQVDIIRSADSPLTAKPVNQMTTAYGVMPFICSPMERA